MRRSLKIRQLLAQASQAASKASSTATAAASSNSTSAATILNQSQHRLASSFTAAASTSGRTAFSTYLHSSTISKIPGYSRSYGFFPAGSINSWKDVHRKIQSYSNIIKPTYEWALGTGYNFRVALINALYTTMPSTHWARLISILLAEAVTRGDPLSWCYHFPVTPKEVAHLEAAEEADILAAAQANKGFFGVLIRYLASWIRLMWLLFLFTPVVVSAPIAIGRNFKRQEWMQLLRRTLERAGPAFIKWGQWAATRADLFPPDFCHTLELLHTQAPAHGFQFTLSAVKSSFGFELEDLFSDFEEAPVASGSIGQIHKAVLSGAGARLTGMKEGSTVAVKVRHPGVSESIERDFALMMAAAKVAERIIPAIKALRLEESLKQFAAPLREQVDLGREGFYLHAFNYNFRKEGNVSFPVPLYPLVSPAVLVETFQPGTHISEYVARGAGAPFNSDLARIGARTMLHMMVVDNLVHSDLHPGNILVQLELAPPGGIVGKTLIEKLQLLANKMAENTTIDFRPNVENIVETFMKPSIVLLDAGMATRLSPEDQINMVGLFDSFSRLNAHDVADWTLRFAGEEQTCPDPEAFRQDLQVHFDELKAADAFAVGDTSSGAEALAAVLETVRQHQVTLPGHICATVVTTLVLEGWSHSLDPAHSTLSEVKRILALKKGETRLKKAAMWVQGAAVDRQILEHIPQFKIEEGDSWKKKYSIF